MWDKLESVVRHYEELGEKLSSPDVANDMALLRKYSKEHKDMTEVVNTYKEYLVVKSDLDGNFEIINTMDDQELVDLAKSEINDLQNQIIALEERIKVLLLPKDPNDDKNVILEIRAGAGGDEAAIFVGDLFRAYLKYAEVRGWKVELLGTSDASTGGYKEVVAMIMGNDAFSRMKYERGVHRVQRVPATETQGRIHTSTITVAVLPEAEEVDIKIFDKDLKIDVYRAGGPGGQSVNTTDSAVRITHIPTGVVVAMQDEKSQLKNKEKAMRVLRARILEKEELEREAALRTERRSQVGTGDRSEKVRTYNYPQSRITDHRIGLSIYSVDQVMNGDLDCLIVPLITHYQTEALKAQSE